MWNGGPREDSSWLLGELAVLSESLQPGSHKRRRQETWGFLLSVVKDNRDSEVSQLTPSASQGWLAFLQGNFFDSANGYTGAEG